MDIPPRLNRLVANAAPDKIWPRADHRVAPSHYIQPLAEIVDIGMRPGDIGKTNIGKLAPLIVEQFRAAVAFVTHRIIIGQDRRAVIDAFLMRGIYITERRAFVKDIVPGE